jgi:hypothetical protein
VSIRKVSVIVKGSQVVVHDHCDGLERDIMEAFHDAPIAGHYGIAKICKCDVGRDSLLVC